MSDLTAIRIVVGIVVYLAMLGLVAAASYALWAGPRVIGIADPWPLVFYFVVPYLGTLLVASGVATVFLFGPELARRTR